MIPFFSFRASLPIFPFALCLFAPDGIWYLANAQMNGMLSLASLSVSRTENLILFCYSSEKILGRRFLFERVGGLVIPWRLLIHLLFLFLTISYEKDVSCFTSSMTPLTNHFLIYTLLTPSSPLSLTSNHFERTQAHVSSYL